jgi:hypothetical protein
MDARRSLPSQTACSREGVEPVAAQTCAQVVDTVFVPFGVSAVLELPRLEGDIDNVPHFGTGNGFSAGRRVLRRRFFLDTHLIRCNGFGGSGIWKLMVRAWCIVILV